MKTLVTHPDAGRRLNVFQSQISRWAGKQQTARDAMTRHASWLRKFGKEIQTTRNVQNARNASKKATTRSSEIASAVLSPKKGGQKTKSKIQNMENVADTCSHEI